MTEVPSPQLRISDQERESALAALGEHLTAGRIDIDEYGDRSARITAAKTRAELGEQFADLPHPHPVYGGTAVAQTPAAAVAAAPAASAAVAPQRGWSGSRQLAAGIVPLAWLVAIVLISTGVVPAWPMIALPIACTIFGRALWGHGQDDRDRDGRDWDDRDRDDRRMDHREHRLDHRDRRRELRDEFRRQRRFDR
ncbi:DUF1707 domain-containing protein [Amycolatopsis sp. PS_44_ISF1]|uniref:DUF1707 SHOCT-like domain-containing protein n=1 Tax=Amycolatopsis sp. PS_44_ISF1 TaxID=2974917 RepID=UPI0028E095F1|nr:DUF1707 domain-containing protein [Amycolatopsis sp. PS_44_ISF1]MDT8909519.1 DUF1707 domain-containing protein [Amycolatopsis sp. PS_44_ISF1]